MTGLGLRHRLVAILAADAAGYSRLMTLDDVATVAALDAARAVFRSHIEAQTGRVIDMAGDSVLAVFETALGAVNAALAIQQDLATLAEPAAVDRRMHFRIGVHLGDVIEKADGTVYGDGVNIASRLQALAEPGGINVSGAVRGVVSARAGVAFDDLGEHRVKNIAQPVHTFSVRSGAKLAPDVAPDETAGAAPAATNMPAALPPLYGREDDLPALRATVLMHSLVSIVGAAGIGKTTLARALAHQLRGSFADGAWIVELAALTDASLVAGAVAQALQIKPGSGPALGALAEALRARSLLLVLDNCEHLLDGAAALAAALHRGAPRITIVATSQAPLKLAHEQVLRLGTLALPAQAGIEVAQRAGAVALFEARARAADPRFALTVHNVDAVVDICRHLDGIALAIELAAARVPLLGVEGLRARLSERFRLLTVGSREAAPRHQTLRAALDWSHDLLAADEQAVLRRLGVFAGSFALGAVQQLAADARLDEWAVLDVLGALVDKSLVVALAMASPDASSADPRFTLLETVREYARQKLLDSGERLALQRRHAEFFAQLAESNRAPPGQSGSVRKPRHLDPDHDNLRACLDWATEHDIDLGLRVAAAIGGFWRERGHHREAMQRGAALLSHPGAAGSAEPRARLLQGLCGLAFEQGDAATLQSLAEQSLAAWRAIGDSNGIALAYAWLANAAAMRRDLASSLALYRESLALFRETGNTLRVAESLTNLGCVTTESGAPAQALPLLHEALALYHQAGNRWGLGFVFESLGEATYALGQVETARSHWQQSLAVSRELEHAHRIGYSLRNLGCAERRLGHLDEAQALLAESLAIGRTHGFTVLNATSLAAMAGVAGAKGDGLRAARLYAAAQKMLDDTAGHLEGPELIDHDNRLAAARALLDAAAWDAAWNEGLNMTTEQAIALALAPSPAAG